MPVEVVEATPSQHELNWFEAARRSTVPCQEKEKDTDSPPRPTDVLVLTHVARDGCLALIRPPSPHWHDSG